MIKRVGLGLVLAAASGAASAQVVITVQVSGGSVSVSDTRFGLGGGNAVVFQMSTAGYRFAGANSGGAFDCNPGADGRRMRCTRNAGAPAAGSGMTLRIEGDGSVPAPGPSPDLWIQND